MFAVLRRVTGVDLLDDLSRSSARWAACSTASRERAARRRAAAARDPATTFLHRHLPEREPVEEAIFFRAELREAGMPFGGVVVNRVHPSATATRPVDVPTR